MSKPLLLRWLRVSILFFASAFTVSLVLALSFPDTMLGFIRKWGAYVVAVATIIEPTSKEAIFVNILVKNISSILLYFIASLFFLAPLLAIISGTFFSLGLVSAIDRGVVPFWHSPILITVEATFVLLTITFASALGTEIFGARPERRQVLDFWKKNWKRLLPKQKRDWRVVFKENQKELILFTIVIIALLLFGAWFEIQG